MRKTDKSRQTEAQEALDKDCDINIARTIELAQQMIELAQIGYEQHKDPSCGVLYGIMLDSGYRILDMAQKEKNAHVKKGWWNTSIKQGDN
jgi:hypothetical protein